MADFKDSYFSNRIGNDEIAARGIPQDATSATRDPVTSNISRQIAAISSMGGYSRPTRFYFEISNLLATVNERLVRNCITTSIPGRSIQSQGYKIYGPPREYAYEANFANEIQMTFRVGSDMFERDFFEGWMSSVISPRTYDLEYPDNYRRTMRIYQLDMQDNKVYAVELYDVFCKNVGEMELNTESTDQISTVNISLGYSDYLTIGKTNFWYDLRKDRNTPPTAPTTEQSRAIKALGDIDFSLNNP
jgi:hypothetical protein